MLFQQHLQIPEYAEEDLAVAHTNCGERQCCDRGCEAEVQAAVTRGRNHERYSRAGLPLMIKPLQFQIEGKVSRLVCAIANPLCPTEPEKTPLLNVAVELASCVEFQCCVLALAEEWLKVP